MAYILLDIGGTKTRVALSRDGESFSEPKIFKTPQDFEEGLGMIKKTIFELALDSKINGIACGIAGPFDGQKSSLVGSPNLKDWVGKPFKKELEDTFGAPVYIENDSALVGLGETIYGAGKEHKIVAYITVSTGLGGVRIVNSRIDAKTIGFEPGHQIIDMSKSSCPDCSGIYLGNYISGKGIEKRTGKKPYEIEENEFWEKAAKYLAYGLNNTIVHWSPSVVILGGSVMKKISIEKVRNYLQEILKIFPELPEIKEAKLGDIGGLYGALAYLQQKK